MPQEEALMSINALRIAIRNALVNDMNLHRKNHQMGAALEGVPETAATPSVPENPKP